MSNIEFHFIETELYEIDKKVYYPASYVRRSFFIEKGVRSAVLHMTALGNYIGFLNGCPVGNELQRPGFTNFRKRLQYQTYDVTSHLLEGENVLGAILGDGYYRGTLGGENKCLYGEKVKLAAELVITYQNGNTQKILTDKSFLASQNGPLRRTDQKVAEVYDARMEMPGWCSPGFVTDDDWHSCVEASYDGAVIPQEGEPLLEQERFAAKVLRTPDGSTVLDFGQNHNGHVEFAVKGKAGMKVELIMGETLDENGNFTIKNITPANQKKPVDWQHLTYILKDGQQTYKSAFMMSGYRYVKLLGWPEEVKAENFISISIYSDLKKTGDFSCSNPQLNQLVSNAKWSQRSNFVDIPTDCPQRERAGWAGDISVFCETANYLMRADRFLDKWLNDFVSIAGDSGNLPYVIPCIEMAGDLTNGSAGWADAIANVPTILYRFYGDKAVLEKVYRTVKNYVDFNYERAKKRNIRHILKVGKHYRYILDTGYHYGEWMEPGSNLMKDGVKGLFFPDEEVATAWWYYTTCQLADMASILELEEEKYYRRLAEKIRSAYRREFLKDGKVHSDRMCRYVRPLYMGLTEGEEAKAIAGELNRMCIAGDYKIGTGFLTTYKLLPTLCDYGYTDTAYKMLLNPEYPGWLYAVGHGATTTWENWKGIDENGIPHDSLNHYSPGAVVSWFFSYCAGIKPLEPGFSRVQIAPVTGGGLTWAKAEYDSIRGKIISSWKLDDHSFTLEIRTPVWTSVLLPNGDSCEVEAGEYTFTCEV